MQDSAYPYHDWNDRITAECYAPNAASRLLDTDGRIIDIVNIYSKISFNFGPTVLSWLERKKPEIYESIQEADRLSMERFSGHGSALAQVYNHMIMPLASRRDKHTQTIWGIRDFEYRFGRMPEGMWLPETAVDMETLEVLVNHGVKFTILSPRQARKVRPLEGLVQWQDVSDERIDPTKPYACILPSGRSIAVFFYDGPTSQDISFGGLLNNGEVFARRLVSLFRSDRPWPQIAHVATDGETYGHHHRFGDMALSYALHYIESKNLARLTNYGEYLEKHPPVDAVEIYENSSWSCIHGVERWRNNCGCHSGTHPGWSQQWRKPLREALDWLRDQLAEIFAAEASQYLKDPWLSRNDYIGVVLSRTLQERDALLERHRIRDLAPEEKIRVSKLLEMERNAMLMYTSCGWFFDEVSGIETSQIMQYAARAIQYAEDITGTSLDPRFSNLLRAAPSNVFSSAAEVYERHIRPSRTDLMRVGSHYCISSVFEEYPDEISIYCYTARSAVHNRLDAGKMKLITGRAAISSDITLDSRDITFAVLHLGDHNINAGIRDFRGAEDYALLHREVSQAFEKGDIPEVVRVMDKHFNGSIYSLWHLFRDEQRKILNEILQLTYESIELSYRQVYENNYSIMSFYTSLQHKTPRPLLFAAEYIINTDLKRCLEEEEFDLEKLKRLMEETKKLALSIDRSTMEFVVSSWIRRMMERLMQEPENIDLYSLIDEALEALSPLGLTLNLWEAQNMYFSIGRDRFHAMRERALKPEDTAAEWVEVFLRLGHFLHVKI